MNQYESNKRIKCLESYLDNCIDIMYFAKLNMEKEKFNRALRLKKHCIKQLETLGAY